MNDPFDQLHSTYKEALKEIPNSRIKLLRRLNKKYPQFKGIDVRLRADRKLVESIIQDYKNGTYVYHIQDKYKVRVEVIWRLLNLYNLVPPNAKNTYCEFGRKTCKHCGIELSSKQRTNGNRFCSLRCANLSRQVINKCAHCRTNEVRGSRKYCSMECFDNARREFFKRECPVCSTTFLGRRAIYCSKECRDYARVAKKNGSRGLKLLKRPQGANFYVDT